MVGPGHPRYKKHQPVQFAKDETNPNLVGRLERVEGGQYRSWRFDHKLKTYKFLGVFNGWTDAKVKLKMMAGIAGQ